MLQRHTGQLEPKIALIVSLTAIGHPCPIATPNTTRAMERNSIQREYQVILSSQAQYPANPFATLSGESPQSEKIRLNARLQYRLRLNPVLSQYYRAEWLDWNIQGLPEAEWKQQAKRVSPWYYRVRSEGTIEVVQREAETLEHHALRVSALWFLQWLKPNERRSEWTVEEPYPSGKVVCRYRRERQTRTETAYRKQFLRFVGSANPKQLEQRITGELRYTFRNRDSALLSVEGVVREQSFSKGTLVSESVNRVQVRLLRERPIDPALVAKWRQEAEATKTASQWRNLVSLPTPEDERQAQARARLGGRSLRQLIEEIQALGNQKGELPPEQQIPLQLALEGAFVLYPNDTTRFAEQLLNETTEPKASFWVVLGAVSGSETGASILLSAYQRNRSPEIQLILARQMVLTKGVNPTLFEQLWQVYQSESDPTLRSALGLALGSWAGQVASRARKAVEPYFEYVHTQIREAEQSQNEEQLRYWLDVTANIGSLEFFPFWERIARRGAEPLRRAVAEMLSSIPTEQTARLIGELVPIEPSATVRALLAQTLIKFWGQFPSVPKQLAQILFNDPDPNVRIAVVDGLVGLAAQHQEAMQILVRASRENSEESVRRRALIGLASLHAQGVPVPRN